MRGIINPLTHSTLRPFTGLKGMIPKFFNCEYYDEKNGLHS